MEFSFVSYSQNGGSNPSSPITVNKPTGVIDGDIMFAFSVGRPVTAPTGWVSVGNFVVNSDNYYYLYYKIASSEGSGYSFTLGGYGKVLIIISAFRNGFNTSSPLLTYSTGVPGTQTTAIAASLNVSKLNCPIIYFGAFYNTSYDPWWNNPAITSPFTFTNNVIYGNTTSDWWTAVCSVIWSGSGNTGNIIGNCLNGGNLSGAFAVALNPEEIKYYNFFQLF